MKLRIVSVAALAVLLVACGSKTPEPSTTSPAPPKAGLDMTKPSVMVRSGMISVSPDPLEFGKDAKPSQIVWSLPADSDFRFPSDGIVIDGEILEKERVVKDQKEIVDCRPINDGRQFTCLNRHTRPGKFKYTIRVNEKGRALKPFDPVIANH